jgi:hypothetical protein
LKPRSPQRSQSKRISKFGGGFWYILKPVDFDKFIDAVKEVGFYWLLLNKPPL